ncbi:MAG: NAD(P)H-dependent oxidoreductase [Erythrobacter sp.]|uniref:FMN-dependent NADH-azoreductase n=1 Tax=Erythrobacter sp. TaxID=1042 RepID=UPI00260CF15D|nr:NAD(P)H-dependent oxidoreductase [Erythrobacter sp.]MDJ0978867.1 NAD(P)H-dependent oxidoreductase [Erythrobacter sp.]
MSNILYLTASIRGDESVSNRIGQTLLDSIKTGGDSLVTRDLATNDIPFQSWERFNAGLTAKDDRTPEQAHLAAYADTLIEELMAADTIVIATPVYNFGVPATVKAWADLVARAGTTFKYTENGPVGLLEGKKAHITAASGGTPIGSGMDYMSSWLTFFLGFLGIKDVEVIAADGIMGADAEAKIAAALDKASKVALAA